MMKSAPASLALGLALVSAAAFPAEKKAGGGEKEKGLRFAAWDDVNVIAHGLLQLGQGLKEHVDKTKVRMRDISAKIKVCDGALGELAAESRRRGAEGEALRARARGLEDREARLLNVTADLREKTDEMRGEGAALTARLGRLEERLERAADARGIQLILEAQNRRMDELTARLELQQEKLDKQNVRIRGLQSQIQQSGQRAFTDAEGFASSEQRDSPVAMASDCHELFLRGETTSGVFSVRPRDTEAFPVFCEMTADGGWTVVQRRRDGSVDFDQLWSAYEKGFGSVEGEFWLGLEKIHAIAKNADHVLKIQLSDWGGDSASIRLPFRLGGAETEYSLRIREVGAFGPLESSLGSDAASGLPFSTRDHDNDRKKETNCARHLSGGWWFSNCGRSNLNGRFFRSPPPKQRHQRKQGIFWKTWRGRYYPLKSSVMMIAPAVIRSES
ncbi:angiopoietin-related protein 4 [Hippocampus zosterae]|uniref:angiopoietin-related protein 4 n=1 Tax=Hippocampus zosterae TaxID=109293 RepID=UPI00223DD279|nr:angiopoietin-related protein 4 [Hippocampus zosterae]